MTRETADNLDDRACAPAGRLIRLRRLRRLRRALSLRSGSQSGSIEIIAASLAADLASLSSWFSQLGIHAAFEHFDGRGVVETKNDRLPEW